MMRIKFAILLFIFTICWLGLDASGSKLVNYKQLYPIKISEVSSHNTNTIRDEKGNFDDWIELFCYGGTSISLNGLYITDDINNLTKHKFEADSTNERKFKIYKKGFRTLWADGQPYQGPKHLNFKLDASGEFIALVAPDGNTIIDSMTIPRLHADVSYGRMGIARHLYYFDKPTPNRWNANPKIDLCKAPKIKLESGFYSTPQVLELHGKRFDIQYNGNIHDTLTTLKQKKVFIERTKVIKVNPVDSNCASGKAKYRSFFISKTHNVPVVSLIIDTTHLWNKFYGIHEGRNYKRRQTRNGYLEYFTKSGKLEESAEVEVKIHGAYSRTYPQKSLGIRIADDSKKKYFKHQFFSKVKNKKYKSFVLRNSGNDWLKSRMKDVVLQSLLDEDYLNVNTQAYEPCVLYVNGEYWGMYNMREKINTDYLRYHYKADKEDVEIIEKHKMPIKGTRDHFDQLNSLLNRESFKKKKMLDSLQSLINVPNYIDYQAIQIYIGNKDWPQNNIKCWRDKHHDKKWNWLIYDLDEAFKEPDLSSIDLALGLDSGRITQFDSIYLRSTLALPKMMENKMLKKRLTNRIFDLMNFTFDSARIAHYIDSIRAIMIPEMDATLKYWYPKHNVFKEMKRDNYFDTWYQSTNRLKRFIPRRNKFMIQDLKEHNWITGTIEFQIEFDPEKCQIFINGIPIKNNGKKFIYSKNNGAAITIVPKTDDTLKVPESWIKKGNIYKVVKPGSYQIK